MAIYLNKEKVFWLKRRKIKPPYWFVSIPKTASNAITLTFKNKPKINMIGHSNPLVIVVKLGYKKFCDTLLFASVRNPYDRVVSMCEFTRSLLFTSCNVDSRYLWMKDKKYNEDKKELLNGFLIQALNYRLQFQDSMNIKDKVGIATIREQLMYISIPRSIDLQEGFSDDDKSKILSENRLGVWQYFLDNDINPDTYNTSHELCVDYLLQFENLQNDWEQLCDLLGYQSLRLNEDQKRHFNRDYHVYYNSENKRIVEDIAGNDIEFFGYKF